MQGTFVRKSVPRGLGARTASSSMTRGRLAHGGRVKCMVFDYMVQNGRSDLGGARVGESGLSQFRRAARNVAFVSAARVT